MTKTIAVCDKCGKQIENNSGLSIQGNIYIAEPDRGGLIGDAFKDISYIDDIPCVDYCVSCFLKGMTEEFRQEAKKYLEIRIREN